MALVTIFTAWGCTLVWS